MSIDSEKRQIDAKGRVTIPQSIREQLNLDAGEHVTIEIEDGTVVIHPQISREEFIATMTGCITAETRRETAEALTPRDLKADWLSDLPDTSEE